MITMKYMLPLFAGGLIAQAGLEAAAQSVTSTTFTYQGHLKSADATANGHHDFRLRLYDAATAGVQVGGQIERTGVAVTNGLFSLPLDFGAAFDGNPRWLEVEVKALGVGSYTTLAPRQAVTAAPQAISAASALNGVPTGFSILGDSETPPAGFSFTGETLGIKEEQWSNLANSPVSILNSWGVVAGGKLYALTDSTLSAYDPQSNTWTSNVTTIPLDSPAACSYVALDDKIYVIGSSYGSETRVDMYDPQTNVWTQKASTNHPVQHIGLASTLSGKIHYVSYGKHESYDPATNSWMSREDFPVSNSVFNIMSLNGKLYAFGHGNTQAFVYDPALDDGPGGATAWASIAPIPSPRIQYQPVTVNGRIHLLGGYNGSSVYYDHHDIYDPQSNTWSTGPKLPAATMGYAAGVIDGEIYMIGGNGTPTTLQKYTPESPKHYIHKKD